MRIAFLFTVACLCLAPCGCSTPLSSSHSEDENAKAWLSDPEADAINLQLVYSDDIGSERYRAVRRSMRSAAIQMLSEKAFVKLSENDVRRFVPRPSRERNGQFYYLLRAVYPDYERHTAGLSIYEGDGQVIVLLEYLGFLGPIQRYPVVALLSGDPARLDVLAGGAK